VSLKILERKEFLNFILFHFHKVEKILHCTESNFYLYLSSDISVKLMCDFV